MLAVGNRVAIRTRENGQDRMRFDYFRTKRFNKHTIYFLKDK